jgi:4'-phosphopantetheinyl transferase
MTGRRWDRVSLCELPSRLDLRPGALHLWSVPLDLPDELIRTWDGCLSEEESDRARNFVHEKDRRCYTVAHASLRVLLSRYTGVAGPTLRFCNGPHGKPSLANSGARTISFNLSHSSDLAIVGVSMPAQLGVDIEQLRLIDGAGAIARCFFAPAENAALAMVPLAERAAAFLTCWTRKEAFVKALGGGLSRGFADFEVNMSRSRPALRVTERAWSTQTWSMFHLEPADNYVGAAVTDSTVSELRLLHLDLAAGK